MEANKKKGAAKIAPSASAQTQVAPISSHALGSSSHPVGDESWLVQQLRGRISQMEKDLVIIHAEVAILKKREN